MGNMITVILTIGAMFMLSWRITLVSLVLPLLLVFPVRFWGRKLQVIVRERYNLDAFMSSFMVERFNVAVRSFLSCSVAARMKVGSLNLMRFASPTLKSKVRFMPISFSRR